MWGVTRRETPGRFGRPSDHPFDRDRAQGKQPGRSTARLPHRKIPFDRGPGLGVQDDLTVLVTLAGSNVEDLVVEVDVLDLQIAEFAHPEPPIGEHMDDRRIPGRVGDDLDEPVGLLRRQVAGQPLGPSRDFEPLGDREAEAPEEAGEPADRRVDRVLRVVALEDQVLAVPLQIRERDLLERLRDEREEGAGDMGVLLDRARAPFLGPQLAGEPLDDRHRVERGIPHDRRAFGPPDREPRSGR